MGESGVLNASQSTNEFFIYIGTDYANYMIMYECGNSSPREDNNEDVR